MTNNQEPVKYVLANLDSETSLLFLASLEAAHANYIINGAPSVPMDLKKKVGAAVKELREKLEKEEAAKPFLEEFRQKSEEIKIATHGKSIWKMPAEFNDLFKAWLTMAKKHKRDLPPGMPELDADNHESDYLIVQKALFEKVLKESGVPEKLPEGGKPINLLVFPENVDDDIQELIIKFVVQQALSANFKDLTDEMKAVREAYVKGHGLSIITDIGFDKLVWENHVKEAESELKFVQLNGHYSNEFSEKVLRMKEKLKEGEKLPKEIRQMERIIAIRNKDTAGGSGGAATLHDLEDSDEETGDNKTSGKKTGTGANSRWAAVLAKAAGIAMKDKKGDVIDMPVMDIKVPVMQYKPFVRVNREETIDEAETAFRNFARRPLPGRIAMGTSREKIRPLKLDQVSVATFMKDNSLDFSDGNDLIYAAIVCQLVEVNAIIPNDTTEVPAVLTADAAERDRAAEGATGGFVGFTQADLDKVVTEGRLQTYGAMARRMLDVSFYYASQGASDGSLKWLESFNKVCGRITSETRFVNICEMIIASGKLRGYCKVLTVGDVHKANDVLKYRLMRISSAGLVFQALKLITNDFVFRMIEPLPLREYYRFYKGGVLAQIAAGPLRPYLDGSYNPLEIEHIPHDVVIGDLQPISVPPYNERLIKQAKIILDLYGVDYGRWYQGERAQATLDTRDLYFREVVKAIKVIDAERVKDIAEAIASEMNIADFGNDDYVDDVKGYVMTYGIGLEMDPERKA